MGKFAPSLRVIAVVAVLVAVTGGYLGLKVYHQMHTVLPLYVVQEAR